MAVMEELVITYDGPKGEHFDLCGGDIEGLQGVRLATESHGTAWEEFFDTNIETIYNSTAFEIGGRYGGLRENMFDFTLAFHVKATSEVPWRIAYSRFRKALSATKDSVLTVKMTGISERYLTVRLQGTPKLKVDVDPNRQKYGLVLVRLIAAYPRWCEDDHTLSYTTTTDTTSSGTESSTFLVANPTNNEIWLKWVAQAGNAGIIWTLPDFSFGDDRFDLAAYHADRMVILPTLILNEHVVVDTDEMTMQGQLVSSLDTQIYQRMNGREFLYPIPAYTDPILLPFQVSNAAIGNVLQVRQPRTWSCPWGLE